MIESRHDLGDAEHQAAEREEPEDNLELRRETLKDLTPPAAERDRVKGGQTTAVGARDDYETGTM